MTKDQSKKEVIMYTCQGVFDGEYGNVAFSKERESVDDHKCIILIDPIHKDEINKRDYEVLDNIVLGLYALEEAYDCLEEIGENVHDFIDKHRDWLYEYRQRSMRRAKESNQ